MREYWEWFLYWIKKIDAWLFPIEFIETLKPEEKESLLLGTTPVPELSMEEEIQKRDELPEVSESSMPDTWR